MCCLSMYLDIYHNHPSIHSLMYPFIHSLSLFIILHPFIHYPCIHPSLYPPFHSSSQHFALEDIQLQTHETQASIWTLTSHEETTSNFKTYSLHWRSKIHVWNTLSPISPSSREPLPVAWVLLSKTRVASAASGATGLGIHFPDWAVDG